MAENRTARERGRIALVLMRDKAPILKDEKFLAFFEKFIDEQQNDAPLGKGDGTLGINGWMALSQVQRALRQLKERIEIAEKELGK